MKSTKKTNKKTKTEYVDDGHTVYSMENLETPWSRPKKKDEVGLTRAEKRAAIRAAFKVYLPIFFGVIACFALVALLLYLWLK